MVNIKFLQKCLCLNYLSQYNFAFSQSEFIYHPLSPKIPIQGLFYFRDFIDDKESDQLINIIDKNVWLQDIKRRQQHYGIVYYHTKHDLPRLQPVQHLKSQALPLEQFNFLIKRQIDNRIFDINDPPNQCLVNEYIENQTIAIHIEDTQAFGKIIAGLTLINGTYFSLRNRQNKKLEVKLFLEKNSLYVLNGEARLDWEHGIRRMKQFENPVTGQTVIKDKSYRRLSLTFRHVLEEGTKKSTQGEPNRFKKVSQIYE